MVDKEFFFQALIYMYCDTKSFVPFRDHNTTGLYVYRLFNKEKYLTNTICHVYQRPRYTFETCQQWDSIGS